MPYPDTQKNTGSYVPTTNIWEIQHVYETDVNSQEFKELFVRLYQNVNLISTVLNTKESAFYLQEEFVTGQSWFNVNSSSYDDLRACFRKVYNVGALGAGLTTYAHGLDINDSLSFVHCFGVANNTTTHVYYPLNYASSSGANNISLYVDDTYININNASGLTFDTTIVVLEFLKN